MDLPKNSPDLDSARDKLHAQYAQMEKITLAHIDDLARSGFSDKRWCAIARTHIEQGYLALHRALRDYPGDDPNEYGKQPSDLPLPKEFTPRPDPEPRGYTEDELKTIQDYRADGTLYDPKSGQP